MSRKWPYIVVILVSFLFGSLWGWRLIQKRNEQEGRFSPENQLKILAPANLISDSLIQEFQQREKIAVQVTSESSPATLLRKLVKSAPGQFDAAFVFHHQIPSLRVERKLTNLFDSRNRFPTVIAPDFRKLPDDRNLMETAPLMWGVIGVATKKQSNTLPSLWEQNRYDTHRAAIGVWPSWATLFLPPEAAPPELARKFQSILSLRDQFFGLGATANAVNVKELTQIIISHGQMEEPEFKTKDGEWTFGSLSSDGRFPLWILTLVAVSSETGTENLEPVRKWMRFLMEPAIAKQWILKSHGGATTLKSLEDSDLPAALKASYLRHFPVHDIKLDRDERVRQADEVLEQTMAGASLAASEPLAHTKTHSKPQPIASDSEPNEVAVKEKPKPKKKVKPPEESQITAEAANNTRDMEGAPSSEPNAEPIQTPTQVAPAAPISNEPVTAPSEEKAPAD